MGRYIHERLDSTNAEAARIAPFLSAPAWILTHDQTRGRGRRGRVWSMPAGNFAATYVMRPTEPAAVMALRSFVAALALAEALGQAMGHWGTLTLKWPNDVLLNGGKVAGILLESTRHAGSVSHLAIGIGVNLAAAPLPDAIGPRTVHPVSVAGETGVVIAPEVFLTDLARAYAAWESRFVTEGFAPVREAWLARAARLGERMVARTGVAETTGVFETMDDHGALVLLTTGGRRAIPAADVFF